MKQVEDYDIVIIGGGITGLALARCLQDSNLRLALVDAGPGDSASPESDSSSAGSAQSGSRQRFEPRVSALTMASTELLRRLKAWEGILAHGACPFQDMVVWDAEGTGSVHFAAAEVHQFAFGYITENAAITASLNELLQQDRLTLLRNTTVEDIASGRLSSIDTHHHRVRLNNGSLLNARLLVGADGGNSLVRRRLNFKVKEWDYGQQAIVTTVKTQHSHNYTAWQRFLPSGPLAFLPLLNPDSSGADDQFYSSIVWSCRAELAQELMGLDDDAFAARLEQAFEARLGRVEQVDPRHAFPLRQMHATNYVAEGAALVGDAAHTIHPLAGQGVNLGLQDVEVLARVIEEALHRHEDFSSRQVLSRYQRQRKGPNLAMMGVMEGFKRLFESDDLMLRWLRNTGFNQVDRLPVVKRQLMSRAMGL